MPSARLSALWAQGPGPGPGLVELGVLRNTTRSLGVALVVSRVVACPSCDTKNRVPDAARGVPTCGSCHHPLQWLVDAGQSDFDQVIDSRLPVLVDLWAPWCGPCRMVAPGVEQAATELAGRLKVVKVNVDEAPEVSARFGVQGIPTLLLLRDGQLVDRVVGALPPDRLLAWTKDTIERVH